MVKSDLERARILRPAQIQAKQRIQARKDLISKIKALRGQGATSKQILDFVRSPVSDIPQTPVLKDVRKKQILPIPKTDLQRARFLRPAQMKARRIIQFRKDLTSKIRALRGQGATDAEIIRFIKSPRAKIPQTPFRVTKKTRQRLSLIRAKAFTFKKITKQLIGKKVKPPLKIRSTQLVQYFQTVKNFNKQVAFQNALRATGLVGITKVSENEKARLLALNFRFKKDLDKRLDPFKPLINNLQNVLRGVQGFIIDTSATVFGTVGFDGGRFILSLVPKNQQKAVLALFLLKATTSLPINGIPRVSTITVTASAKGQVSDKDIRRSIENAGGAFGSVASVVIPGNIGTVLRVISIGASTNPVQTALAFATGGLFGVGTKVLGSGSALVALKLGSSQAGTVYGIAQKVGKNLIPLYFLAVGGQAAIDLGSKLALPRQKFKREVLPVSRGFAAFQLGATVGGKLTDVVLETRLGRVRSVNDFIVLRRFEKQLAKQYGKNSKEYKESLEVFNIAFGKLPQTTAVQKPFNANLVESIKNEPKAIKVVNDILRNPKNNDKFLIFGTGGLVPQVPTLKRPPRRTINDIDADSLVGGKFARAITKEIETGLLKAGFNKKQVRFVKEPFRGLDKFSVEFRPTGKGPWLQLWNIKERPSITFNNLEEVLGTFDLPPRFAFRKDKFGIQMLNLRDQLRRKVFGFSGIGSAARPKDLKDLLAVGRELKKEFPKTESKVLSVFKTFRDIIRIKVGNKTAKIFNFKGRPFNSKFRANTINKSEIRGIGEFHHIDPKTGNGVFIPKSWHKLLHAINEGLILGKNTQFFRLLRIRRINKSDFIKLKKVNRLLASEAKMLQKRFDKAVSEKKFFDQKGRLIPFKAKVIKSLKEEIPLKKPKLLAPRKIRIRRVKKVSKKSVQPGIKRKKSVLPRIVKKRKVRRPSVQPKISKIKKPPSKPPRRPPSKQPRRPPSKQPSRLPSKPLRRPPSRPPSKLPKKPIRRPGVPPTIPAFNQNQINILTRKKIPFNVFVREKGKIKKINRRPLTAKSAFALLHKVAENTSIRSGFIRKTTGKAFSNKLKPIKLNQYRKPRGKTKLSKISLVEKTKFAINTPGEKRGITAKGIRASRRRILLENLKKARKVKKNKRTKIRKKFKFKRKRRR